MPRRRKDDFDNFLSGFGLLVLVFLLPLVIMYYCFIWGKAFFYGDSHEPLVYEKRRKYAQVIFPGLARLTSGDIIYGLPLTLIFFFAPSISATLSSSEGLSLFVILNLIRLPLIVNDIAFVNAFFEKGLQKGKSFPRFWYLWKVQNEYEEWKPARKDHYTIRELIPSSRTDSLNLINQEASKAGEDKLSKVKKKSSNMKKGEALRKLKELIGLEDVKEQILLLTHYQELNHKRNMEGIVSSSMSLHSIFSGNPGTGKTEVARLMGQLLYDIGILKSGHLVEADRSDLVGRFQGETAIKTKEIVETALGGVLFIDEAYSLVTDSADGYGKEAINTLIKLMEDHRDNFVVILAGYTDNMVEFLQYNPGLKSRIPNEVEFKDYSIDQLLKIWNLFLGKEKFHYNSDIDKDLLQFFEQVKGLELHNFGNARVVRNLFDAAKKQQAKRVSTFKTMNDISEIKDSDINNAINQLYKGKLSLKKTEVKFDELLAELNSLVGLQSIKMQIEKQVNFFLLEKKRNQTVGKDGKRKSSNHMIFIGNPGTGKTTVARLMGKVYQGLNILSSGHLVEASRSDFIAEFQGQTALKTKRKIESAMGGVLFIDEAYSLNYGENDNFGQEAIDTIIKIMEDHKENLIIVFAGYNREMEDFLRVNSGLKSRIRHTLIFEDYSPIELLYIFKMLTDKAGFSISKSVEKHLLKIFEKELSKNLNDFGNGRFVRNLLETALENQANRLTKSRTISNKSMYSLAIKDLKI